MSRSIKDLPREEALKEASGSVILGDSLSVFLYMLMRDYLPAGKVEKLVQDSLNAAEENICHNGFLASYASNLTDELRDGRMKALSTALSAAFTGTDVPKLQTKKQLQTELELTPEITEAIEKGYERLPDDEREQKERELESGESASLKEMAEKIEEALDEEARNVTDDELEFAAKVQKTTSEAKVQKITSEAKVKPEDPSEDEMLSKIEEARKRQAKAEYQNSINASLSAIDRLKTLVPSDTVAEVAKILRQEVEAEAGVGDAEEALKERAKELEQSNKGENKPKGAFRRVPTELAIEDDDIIFTTKGEKII